MEFWPDDKNGRAGENSHKQRQEPEGISHLWAHLLIETEVIHKVETGSTPNKIQLQHNKQFMFVQLNNLTYIFPNFQKTFRIIQSKNWS